MLTTWFRVAPVIVVLALVLAGIAATWPPPFDLTTPGRLDARALAMAVGPNRHTEGRVTGGFAYGPWLGAVRSGSVPGGGAGGGSIPQAHWRGFLTAQAIRAHAEGERDTAALHLRARAHLVLREPDDAVALLGAAVQRGPASAYILSDLAAAYLARATNDTRSEDLPKAVAMAERALALNARLPEALFNRALALEHLPLPSEAVKAWDGYLAIDRRSDWAEEARRRRLSLLPRVKANRADHEREALARALTACRPSEVGALLLESAQAAREFVERDLLTAWATATMSRRFDEAARTLDHAHCAAQALDRNGGDHLSAATVFSLKDAGPAQRERMAQALVTYDEGRDLYDDDRIADSQPRFLTAVRLLTNERSPFVVRVTFDLALTYFYERRAGEAVAILDRVIREGLARRYLDLVGRAYWVRALLRPMPAGYDSRLADYRESLRAFEQAREWPHAAAVHVLLAETHQLYGDSRSAWRHRRQALEALPITSDPRRRHVLLLDGARASLREDLPETAAHFSNALLDAAFAWRRDFAIAEAYRARAESRLKLGRVADADADLRQAQQALARVPDRGLTARLDPFLRTTLAELQLNTAPELARTLASEAMALQRASGYGHYLPRLRLLRARAYLADRRPGDAATELAAGIDEIEQQRVTVADPEARRTYLDDCWDLYRTMVEVQSFALNRPDRGLAFAERGRARRLSDRQDLPGEQIVPASWPADTVGLAYVVLHDRTLLWMLHGGRAEFRPLAVPRAHLESLIRAYTETLGSADGEARLQALGSELYELLVAPAATLIADRSTIVIVPDEVLVGIPFGALRRAGSSRPLGFGRAISVAPSAGAYLHLLQRTRTPLASRTGMGRALTITSSVLPPSLPALPFAALEARALAAVYPRHDTIDAGRSSKSDLLKALPLHGVVHIALHTIAGSNNLDPYLVLGDIGKQPDAGVLSSREVEALSLETVRLVVLAGCSTARGVPSRAEGVVSLASSFLVAGVPTVLASLWDVEDRTAHELVVRFHKRLARGQDAGHALADAQQSMREDADAAMRSTRNWAGFVLLGAPVSIGSIDSSDSIDRSDRELAPSSTSTRPH